MLVHYALERNLLKKYEIEDYATKFIINNLSDKKENLLLKIQQINTSESRLPNLKETNANTAFIDKDLLKFPLIVRKWNNGDYFYPIGLQGRKKLSKYFKDEKLSLIDKENIWLLCSENKIVWIIGKRSDNRFKITDKTKNVLKITMES